jgi:hypothetical protein
MGAPGQVDPASRNPAVNCLSGGDQDLAQVNSSMRLLLARRDPLQAADAITMG